MNRKVSIAWAAGAVFSVVAGPAAADTIFDVEHARAKARAGYDLTEHDAELLNRWGDHSGSRWYDEDHEPPYGYFEPPPPRRYYRRYWRD